jgi:hypothetical protein
MNAGVLKARLRPVALDKAVDLYREVVLGGYWKVSGARRAALDRPLTYRAESTA